jgi:hypothetical protein
MVDFPSHLAQGLTEEVKEAIDYWKEYKGELVRIEHTQIEVRDVSPPKTVKTTYGVEGTIIKVMTLPAGFLLEDARYFVNPEMQSLDLVPEGGSYSEKKGEMFIAFDSIDEMVFVDR